MRLGQAQEKTYIAGINGVPVSGSAVYVSSSGQLGFSATAGRFVAPPTLAATPCTQGDFSADGNFTYVCRATDLWVRSAITAW